MVRIKQFRLYIEMKTEKLSKMTDEIMQVKECFSQFLHNHNTRNAHKLLTVRNIIYMNADMSSIYIHRI